MAGRLFLVLTWGFKACLGESCSLKTSTTWWGCTEVSSTLQHQLPSGRGGLVNVTGGGTGSGRRAPCLRINNLLSISSTGMAVGSSAAWGGRKRCDGGWSSSLGRTGHSRTSLANRSFC